ncbi:MAG TPA: 8-oxo-dGTP diphosphatase MutT [Porticoccaceae bacterium]|nr:8-oxo-dGTP diphosphatase MutT [Porticoccaceae bacterium]
MVLVSAVALIDVDGRILLAQRPEAKSLAGLWEFPGGKVEVNEQPQRALARELREELAIEIEVLQPYMQISHDYPDKNVLLDIWTVRHTEGQMRGVEGQECRWISLPQLAQAIDAGTLQFPDANQPILQRLLTAGF